MGAFAAASPEKTRVVATRPEVPVEGMETLCGCRVVWIDPDDRRTLAELLGEVPRAIVASGWTIPAFNRHVDEVKRDGGTAVAMVDNNFVPSFKERLRSLRFRLSLRKRFDGYLVPGKSGKRLLRFYGVDGAKISTGMYSADASLFSAPKPLAERPRRIVYVGQFIERKNVLRLVDAFREAADASSGDWELHLYGSGPLEGRLREREKKDGRIRVHGFVQPERLPGIYGSARIFCLPSLEEHWGLVVHEAALCGCVLLTGRNVGAAEDFLSEGVNGFSFDPRRRSDIATALEKAMAMDGDGLETARRESMRLAGGTTIGGFVDGVRRSIRPAEV